jgi:hypothetical protein
MIRYVCESLLRQRVLDSGDSLRRALSNLLAVVGSSRLLGLDLLSQ